MVPGSSDKGLQGFHAEPGRRERGPVHHALTRYHRPHTLPGGCGQMILAGPGAPCWLRPLAGHLGPCPARPWLGDCVGWSWRGRRCELGGAGTAHTLQSF